MRIFKGTAALFLVIIAAAPVNAAIHVYSFPMDVTQEVPPVTSGKPTGYCTVTLDDAANTVSVSCTYSGLSSNANAAHIHTGAVGATGSPIVTLAFTAATSGTATITNDPMSAGEAATMIAGGTYVNVHSVSNSGGEIRGQVMNVVVPAVSTVGLLVLLGLTVVAGVVVIRRHRQSSGLCGA